MTAYETMLRQMAKRKARMLELHKAGASFAAIGRKFGISRARVQQILGPRKNKLPKSITAEALSQIPSRPHGYWRDPKS